MKSEVVNIRFTLRLSDIVLMSVIFLLTLGLNILYFKDFTIFHEGRIISNTQALVLLIAGIVALVNAQREAWQPYKKWYVLLGLFLLFVMFEELDWGQPFFKFDSPEIFTEYAYQEQFSLHHLVMGMFDIPIHTVLFIFSTWVLIKWDKYETIPVFNKLPRLTKLKFVLFILITAYYSIAGFILYNIPMIRHGFNIFTMKEKFGLIQHDHYHEIIELMEYCVTLVLAGFKPQKL